MISIVMAADKNYFYPLITAIASILENKKPETAVEFYLFIDEDYTEEDKNRINQLLATKGVSPAVYFDVSAEYANTKMHTEHITAATYYRLRIPSSLPHVDKCLYMDVDTLVLSDLSSLFEKPMDDAYIMGVLAAAYLATEGSKRYKAKILGIPNGDSYVNAGVLVFNLARMREDDLEKRFDRLIQEDFPDQDQDILNAACYGGIKLLPPEYNAMTKYEFEDDFYVTDDAIPKCWSKWEWEKARTDPSIVHFADRDKPWTNFAVPFAKEWWHYAKIAGVAEESFEHFFEAHAATETKIRKLTTEKHQVESDRDDLAKHYDQAQKNETALASKLEKSDSDLKAQVAANKELEAKLKVTLQSQKNVTEDLAIACQKISTLEEESDSLKKQYKLLSSQFTTQAQQLQKATKRVTDLEHSNSYRLGRALSAPFRWVKRKLKRAK